MNYWGGKYVSVCKACDKLGGRGHAPLGNFDIGSLLLDAIWWNLGLFSHEHTCNLPFIVSLKLL